MVTTPAVIKVEILNGAQVSGNLRRIGSSLDTKLLKVAGFLVQDMAEAARDLVAKDEREVEKNIKTELRAEGWTVVADRGGVRDEVAVYLEIGTHKMAPRPYMVPAVRLSLAGGGLLRAVTQAGGLLGRTNI